MATLNGGISADTELIRVSGTLPEPGTYFTLDDEAFKANGAARGAQGRNFTRDYLAVDRGVAGTTKATHSNGATLTPYYPDAPGGTGSGGVTVTGSQGGSVSGATTLAMPGVVSDLGSGVAGVGLVFYQIGPIAVAFDTPGLVNPFFNGIEVADLPEGATVVAAWLNGGDGWTGAAGPYMQLAVGKGDSGGLQDVVYLDLLSGNGTFDILSSDVNGTGYIKQQVVGSPDLSLVAAVYTDSGTPDAGTGAIYAIVATPAS